jgi:hypothetical protein
MELGVSGLMEDWLAPWGSKIFLGNRELES